MNFEKGSSFILLRRLTVIVLVLFSTAACSEKRVQADIVMYKDPQCGCCDKWAEHVREAGFSVEIRKTANVGGIKTEHGIDPSLQSCHTAIHSASGLVFEGHVPVSHMSSLVENPPDGALGLTVPGMPIGSPGMEMGERKDQYDVLLLRREGPPLVYATENAR